MWYPNTPCCLGLPTVNGMSMFLAFFLSEFMVIKCGLWSMLPGFDFCLFPCDLGIITNFLSALSVKGGLILLYLSLRGAGRGV